MANEIVETQPPTGAARRPLRRLVAWLLGAGLAVVAAVLALGILYAFVTPVSTLMIGRWLTGAGVSRMPVPLGAIAPALPLAVLASEDGRFCLHAGVDWGALREVIQDDDGDGPSRGASTISMQTAKNLFLWPGRSYLRKALELPLALYLDFIWGKRRMMEVYLNIAEWGEGLFGAEAAARHYFRKAARDLSRREAALLAVALPNPWVRNPGRPSRGLQALAARLQRRMETAAPFAGCLRASERGH